MSQERVLSDEELVRLVIEEAGDLPASAVNQILYLFERTADGPMRFRFSFQPFLGMRAAEVDGLVQSARMSLMLGRNGMAEPCERDVRKRLRSFLAIVPKAEHDLRLIAVSHFVARHGWHQRARVTVEEMLDRARRQFAPEATIATAEAVELVRRLFEAAESDPVPGATASD